MQLQPVVGDRVRITAFVTSFHLKIFAIYKICTSTAKKKRQKRKSEEEEETRGEGGWRVGVTPTHSKATTVFHLDSVPRLHPTCSSPTSPVTQ